VRLVQQPVRIPHRCAVIPYVGATHPSGFFDTGTDFAGFRVYVSVVAVQEMARQLKWVPAGTLEHARADTAAAMRRVAELEAKVAELERVVGAVQTLKAAGYQQARKPGRPPKTSQEEVANAA
jgi:outer membrane murein-binding lipoprotein Lpp